MLVLHITIYEGRVGGGSGIYIFIVYHMRLIQSSGKRVFANDFIRIPWGDDCPG
jgi:hypothetical protein